MFKFKSMHQLLTSIKDKPAILIKAFVLLLLLAIMPFSLSGQTEKTGQEKRLRVGHYHTEEQAAELLKHFMATYPTLELWQIQGRCPETLCNSCQIGL